MMSCNGRSTSACTGSIGPSDNSSEEGVSLTDLPKGLGPRIYVGGIPNALSQTMIRNHFNHYGKAANVAVSQSNRKINGQLVSSIAATADRPMHHRAGRPAAPTPSTPEAINMQPQLCHAYAKAALEPHHLSVAALQQALAGHNVWPGQASFAPFTQPIPDLADASSLHALLQQHSLIQTNPALAILLAANSQGNMAQGRWNGDLGTLPTDVLSRHGDPMQSAALASNTAACCSPYMHMEEAATGCHAMPASDSAPMFGNPDLVPSFLNAAGVLPPSMAPETWPGPTEWLYQPSLQPSDMPSNLPADAALADSSGSFPALGPQRHRHLRDLQNARHSPY